MLFHQPKTFYFLGLLFIFLSCGSKQSQDKPNIVWFVSEDNSPYMGVYGNSLVHTPNLDIFASTGILYENAFSNAPVCAPSRSGIITGVLPLSMGTQHMRSQVVIDDNIRFFTTLLQEEGYFTTLRRKRDYNIEREDLSWDDDDWWEKEDALRGKSEKQPFFLFYNTFMTHEDKLHSPQKIEDYFKSTFSRYGERFVDSLRQTIHQIDPSQIKVPDYLPDIPEVRSDMAHYFQCMEMMDLEFNLFIDYLKSIGEYDNTIIIYASDHGGVMGRGKRFPFETGLKVPLIVSFPEKHQHLAPHAAGSKTDELVTFLDVSSSILKMAGINTPNYMHGRSLLIKGNETKNEFAFGFRDRMDEAYDLVRTIRDKKFRYIQNYMPQRQNGQHIDFLWRAPHIPAWENFHLAGLTGENTSQFWLPKPAEALYDIGSDPYEVNNLAEDPGYAKVLQEMRHKTISYLKEIGDVGFVPEGILYENFKEKGIIYQQQYRKASLGRLIDAAFQAVNNPNPEFANSLSNDPDPSFRFWAALAYLRMGDLNAESKDSLLKLSQDEKGDVRVMAAESLYHLGEKSLAEDILISTLNSENPYVVIRALGLLKNLKIRNQGHKGFYQTLMDQDFPEGEGYIKRQLEYLLAY